MNEEGQLRIIMRFLKDKGFVEAYLQLEKDSNTHFEHHSKEIEFCRKIILDGDFKEALSFLEPFETKLSEKDYKAIIMALHRQRLFELVENPDEIELRELLEKDILPWCTEEQYQELFQCLTLKSMKQLPQFQKWNVPKGRLNCFEIIRPYIELIESHVIRKDVQEPLLEDVFAEYFSKDRNRTNSHEEMTLNPFQEEPLREESRLDSEIRNPSSIEQRGRKEYPNRKLQYPKDDDLQQKQSNKFPSRPISQKISQKDNFTFSQGKKAPLNYKMKLLSTIFDERAIRVCQFSHDGKHLAIGTNSSYLRIYNVEDVFEDCKPRSELELVYEIQGLHSKSIFSLDWTPNKKLMVTCSNDATVKVTRFNNLKSHETSVLGKHEGCIRMVRFDPSATRVASCAEDNLIKIWDLQKSRSFLVLKGHHSSVNGVKVTSSNLLYSVSKDCTVRAWDLRTGQSEGVSRPSDSEMTYIARGTQDIVVSQKNGCLGFYNSSLQSTNMVKVHDDEIRSVEGLLEQNLLVTSSFDGNVCLVKLLGGRMVQQYHRHNAIKDQDKVVHAVFNRNLGFASSSNLGVCNVFAMI